MPFQKSGRIFKRRWRCIFGFTISAEFTQAYGSRQQWQRESPITFGV
jgi:hypothetical protein